MHFDILSKMILVKLNEQKGYSSELCTLCCFVRWSCYFNLFFDSSNIWSWNNFLLVWTVVVKKHNYWSKQKEMSCALLWSQLIVGHCKEGNIWSGSNEPLELGLSLEFSVLNIIFHAYWGNARMRKRDLKLWDEWKRIQPWYFWFYPAE